MLLVIRVLDGDSYKITAPFLPTPLGSTLTLRVAGIDTPEAGWRARCDRELHMASHARELVELWFKQVANDYSVNLYKWDKYGGRVLGDIQSNKKGIPSISKYLIQNGCAVAYSGAGQRHDWCQYNNSHHTATNTSKDSDYRTLL